MTTSIYEELTKAQNQCFEAKEDNLFDLCQYHIDYYFKYDLSKSEELEYHILCIFFFSLFYTTLRALLHTSLN